MRDSDSSTPFCTCDRCIRCSVLTTVFFNACYALGASALYCRSLLETPHIISDDAPALITPYTIGWYWQLYFYGVIVANVALTIITYFAYRIENNLYTDAERAIGEKRRCCSTQTSGKILALNGAFIKGLIPSFAMLGLGLFDFGLPWYTSALLSLFCLSGTTWSQLTVIGNPHNPFREQTHKPDRSTPRNGPCCDNQFGQSVRRINPYFETIGYFMSNALLYFTQSLEIPIDVDEKAAPFRLLDFSADNDYNCPTITSAVLHLLLAYKLYKSYLPRITAFNSFDRTWHRQSLSEQEKRIDTWRYRTAQYASIVKMFGATITWLRFAHSFEGKLACLAVALLCAKGVYKAEMVVFYHPVVDKREQRGVALGAISGRRSDNDSSSRLPNPSTGSGLGAPLLA